MFRQLISIVFVLFAIPTLNLDAAFGRDDASKTYRCTAKDAVSAQEDGTLNKEIGEIHRKYLDGIVIDIRTGDITRPSTGTRENRVVQTTAANDNDYVLAPASSLRRKKAAANATTDFILLRTKPGTPQATFMALSLTYFVTGTCETVQ